MRVRHDDEALRPHTQRAAVIGSAIALSATVEGMRAFLGCAVGGHRCAVGDRCAVTVLEHPEGVAGG